MRAIKTVLLAGFAVVLASASPLVSPGAYAQANKAPTPHIGVDNTTDFSAQRRRVRRPVTRLRVYRDYRYLPPTAVRACDAWYAQEYRPSGTVIVPRMRCRWVNG